MTARSDRDVGRVEDILHGADVGFPLRRLDREIWVTRRVGLLRRGADEVGDFCLAGGA